jgi:phenylpropionate dioxygenase-like ring-hydroxylating dioxygenase large terminal subunit
VFVSPHVHALCGAVLHSQVQIAGAPIILANDKGTIRAFHNVCRHRGAQLVSEKCTNRRTILCPYHRWGYALDGRLMGTPSFDDDPDGKKVPEKLRELFKTGQWWQTLNFLLSFLAGRTLVFHR